MYIPFRNPVIFAIILVPLSWLCALNSSYGQWTDHNAHDPGIVAVQATVPAFDESIPAESPSSLYQFYSRFYLGNNLSVIASLPISHFSSTTRTGESIDKTAAGNPYLGIRLESISSGLALETAFRLPVATNNDGILTGLLMEEFVREAFLPESASFKAQLQYHYEHGSGLVFLIGGGPHYRMLKGAENEVWISYYTRMHLRKGGLTLGVGLTGMGVLSDSDLSVREKADQSLDFMTAYTFGRLRAGTSIRFPLGKELRNNFSYSAGFSLGYKLNTGSRRASERLRHKDRAVN